MTTVFYEIVRLYSLVQVIINYKAIVINDIKHQSTFITQNPTTTSTSILHTKH